MQLELSALPRGLSPVSDSLRKAQKAIRSVQEALADGPYVELHRLEQICSVWKLSLDSLDEEKRKSLATKFEVNLYKSAGNELKHDTNYLRNLEDERKIAICEELSGFLCGELKRQPIDPKIIRETVAQAAAALSYREALIYRDWQDAIGDAVLERDDDSVRRYKIVGYEAFEKVLKRESPWAEVFRNSIVDIDFDAIDYNDFRAKQLRDLATGVSNILISIAEKEKDLVSEEVAKIADELANPIKQRS